METIHPENEKERARWTEWKAFGLTDEKCVIQLKQYREEEKAYEERKAHLLELYKQGKASAEELMILVTPKQEREANIVIACILAVPVILIVLAVFFFVCRPMILMIIIWVIGMLLAMAFGR